MKKVLKQLLRTRFLRDLKFPLFSMLLRSRKKRAGISNAIKNRVIKSCSYVFPYFNILPKEPSYFFFVGKSSITSFFEKKAFLVPSFLACIEKKMFTILFLLGRFHAKLQYWIRLFLILSIFPK